jgi:hypothetical protein
MPLVSTMLQFSKRARKIKITVKPARLRKFVRWHSTRRMRLSQAFPAPQFSAVAAAVRIYQTLSAQKKASVTREREETQSGVHAYDLTGQAAGFAVARKQTHWQCPRRWAPL